MSEWSQTTLGEIAAFQNGYPFKPQELSGRGLPVIRIRQLLDPTAEVDYSDVDVPDRFRLRDGDLVFSWSATLAARIWTRGDAWLNQHLFRVTEAKGVEREFVRYVLDHAVEELGTKTHGTTMKHVKKGVLEAHPVSLPPLPEQRRIVNVMTAVDAQIEALEGEAQAAWVAYQCAPELLWRNAARDEAAPRPLSEVMALDVKRVALSPTGEYRLAGVLNSGQGLIDKGPFLGSETEYKVMNLISTNQVIMRKLTAWEGPIAVAPVEFDGFVASNEFPTFTLAEGIDPRWMRHVCRTSRLWTEMRNRVTGSVQRRKRLNPEQLLSVQLPVPPLDAQRRAADALDGLLERHGSLSTEAQTLRASRAALLNSLLNQSITIPESYDALLERGMEVAS